MSQDVMNHISLLGYKVKDKVTGIEGVVTTMSFDLYGCIQALVHPGMKSDGTAKEQYWYDVSRLNVLTKKPVMDQPNYDRGYVDEGRKGSAEKPRAMGA
ncbi:MAG: hypothetical protein ACK5M8_05750 [Shewanella algae]